MITAHFSENFGENIEQAGKIRIYSGMVFYSFWTIFVVFLILNRFEYIFYKLIDFQNCLVILQ